jgi:hypothetical protein
MIRAMAVEHESPGQLLGQLADELSMLVRNDVELSAAERMPEVKNIAKELAALVAAAVAGLFVLGAGSWAAGIGLSHVMAGWAAALVVAGAWALVAFLLFGHEYSRRLVARLSEERRSVTIAGCRTERDEAQQKLLETAEHLAAALVREAEAQGMRAAASMAKRGVQEVEEEAGNLLTQLADALMSPGKAGLSIIDRLRGEGDAEDA